MIPSFSNFFILYFTTLEPTFAFLDYLVGNGEALRLQSHPVTGEDIAHYPEPELAIRLGANHTIDAYTLAVDFTNELELTGRSQNPDGTYNDGTFYGKCWRGCGSLGPVWIKSADAGDIRNLDIMLTVLRNGEELLNMKICLNLSGSSA